MPTFSGLALRIFLGPCLWETKPFVAMSVEPLFAVFCPVFV